MTFAATSPNAGPLADALAKVVLARGVRQQLLDLQWPLIDAVEDALGLLERQLDSGHALGGRLRGLRSLRIGAYRIIYQLSDNDQTVRVVAIRNRSIAYRTAPPLNGKDGRPGRQQPPGTREAGLLPRC
jgi:mRNA-degrading endonuclease RelE of RelBE toxin-antitoxin system